MAYHVKPVWTRANTAAFGETGFERRLEPGEDDGEVI
jgi:hypothetical protein